MAALTQLIARLNADLEPQAVLQIVCAEAADMLHARAAVACAYDEQLSAPSHVSALGATEQAALELLPRREALPPPDVTLVDRTSAPKLTLGLWHHRRPVGALALLLPTAETELDAGDEELLIALAGLAAQALVSAQRLAAARLTTDDLEAINTLSRALAETLVLEQIFELLYQAAVALLPSVAGAIFSLYNAERQEITCAYAILDGQQLDPSEFPPLPLVPPGRGFQGDAIHTRRPVIIGSLEELQERRALYHYVGDEGEASESILFVPMLSRDRVVGVLQVQSFTAGSFGQSHATRLGLAANVAAVAIENARLVGELQRSNRELLKAYDSTLEGWSRALDLRDQETQGHSQRVMELTVRLARAAGMNEQEVTYVRWGALLHDIGKVGIPDAILLKPGALDEEEWRVMRQHPVYAYNLLRPIEFLHPALDIPYCHHERWDGAGYPRGLSGEAIPLAARLFAVVDIWDALRSERPYRPAWPEERVRAHIRSLAGNHLDPAVVTLFFAVLDGPAEAPVV